MQIFTIIYTILLNSTNINNQHLTNFNSDTIICSKLTEMKITVNQSSSTHLFFNCMSCLSIICILFTLHDFQNDALQTKLCSFDQWIYCQILTDYEWKQKIYCWIICEKYIISIYLFVIYHKKLHWNHVLIFDIIKL